MSALSGKLVAISVSEAPDRARLGFPQREVDRVLLSTCTALVRAGADVAYGGNLDPEGYTFKIFRHLASAYPGQKPDTPFRHIVPEPVGRLTRYEDLFATLNEGRGTVRTELVRGEDITHARPGNGGIRLGDLTASNDADLAAWYAAVPETPPAQAHSVARRLVSARADARIILGGKMGVLADPNDHYQGVMPGIAEEAILTLQAGKPLIVLGAFGGVSRDIGIALGLLDGSARVSRSEQVPSYAAAIAQVEALQTMIPAAVAADLAKIADDDRAEQNAFALVALIERWLTAHAGALI